MYQRCRPFVIDRGGVLGRPAAEIAQGIGSAGKFERYFALFRTRVLPLVHSRQRIERLLAGGDVRRATSSTARWDTCAGGCCSRSSSRAFVMGRLGRDPAFFRYVEGSVADRILARTRHALTELDPAANPYLHWILTGTHTTALPLALRAENFDAIRRTSTAWSGAAAVEDFLDKHPGRRFDRFNLSDIFEYMSEENYRQLLER